MCFSASASFGASVVLTTIGIISLKKVQNPSQIPFATVPLLFAAQQLSEGFLWLALKDPSFPYLETFTTLTFIFFAQVVWPTWVPFSIYKMEEKGPRKKILLLIVIIGLIVSTYLAYCLFSFKIEAAIDGKHISYHQDYPNDLKLYGGVLYLIATIVSSFVSGVKWMPVLGCAILVSYIMTEIFYSDYVISVWCFFASVISVTIYIILRQAGLNSSASDSAS